MCNNLRLPLPLSQIRSQLLFDEVVSNTGCQGDQPKGRMMEQPNKGGKGSRKSSVFHTINIFCTGTVFNLSHRVRLPWYWPTVIHANFFTIMTQSTLQMLLLLLGRPAQQIDKCPHWPLLPVHISRLNTSLLSKDWNPPISNTKSHEKRNPSRISFHHGKNTKFSSHCCNTDPFWWWNV